MVLEVVLAVGVDWAYFVAETVVCGVVKYSGAVAVVVMVAAFAVALDAVIVVSSSSLFR